MIDCNQAAKRLLEFLDKELNPDELQKMEHHLEECRACFDHLEFERLLRTHLQKKTEHLCPEKVKTRIEKLLADF